MFILDQLERSLVSLSVHAAVPSLDLRILAGRTSYLSLCYDTDLVAFVLTSAIFIEPSLSSTIRLRITYASESAATFFDPILPHMRSGLLNCWWPSSSALRPHILVAISRP